MPYKNKEDAKEYHRLYNLKNKESRRLYRLKNKDKINEYYKANKMEAIVYQQKYRLENKDKINERNKEYMKTKYSSDIQYRIRNLLRNRLRDAVKNKYKSGSAVRDLGCSMEFFISHIESQFKDGMSWENQGKWHFDHIIPLVKFNLEDREELLKVAHYTNYQPLWAIDNLIKGKK